MGRGISGWQFCASQKGGTAVGKTKRGKGTKWMVLVDGQGLPLGVRLESASPGEATLAEATLKEVRVPRAKGRPRQKPKRVIADRAYDSDPLRERLKKRGIELIAPYRKNNKQRRYEDGNCAATSAAGSSSGPMHGSVSSDDSWLAMSISLPPSARSSTSPVSGSPSGDVYETDSSMQGRFQDSFRTPQ